MAIGREESGVKNPMADSGIFATALRRGVGRRGAARLGALRRESGEDPGERKNS